MSPTGTDPDNSTRKQRREQAREDRRALEAAEAAGAARKRRLMQLGAVAGIVVIAIVVIVLATGSKENAAEKPAEQTHAANKEALEAVKSEIGGISQSGNTLGNANAPVTLQYFGDLECPVCREFTLGALPGIIQSEVRSGKLKIEYRSLSTATGNAEQGGSEPNGTFISQQVAAYAAGKQNLGWYYIETFYHEQGAEGSGYVNERYIQGIAEQVPGLNLTKWSADRSDKALELQVINDEKAANAIGFTGTPSFMIGKTGSTLKPFQPTNFQESSAFEAEINKLAS